MKLFGGKTESPETTPPETSKPSFFSRMKQAVTRTRESFSSRIGDVVALTRTVDEAALEDLESALLTSDIGVQTTTEILAALRDRARHQAIEGGEELRALLKAQLRAILEAPRNNPVTAPAGAAKSHLPRRRQRHRQNHLRGQAGRLVPRPEPHRAALRCRHLSRRGHRAAGSLGFPHRRGDDQDPPRRRPGGGSLRCRLPRPKHVTSTS